MNANKKAYGGFWKRLIAYIIDAIIIAGPVSMIFASSIPDDIVNVRVEDVEILILPQTIADLHRQSPIDLIDDSLHKFVSEFLNKLIPIK